MNSKRLFTASCIALITSAFSFMIRGDISDALGAEFALTKEAVGAIMGAAFLGMAITMVIFAPLCDFLGMGRVLFCAWVCHLTGILGTIFAREIADQSFVQNAVASLGLTAGARYWVLFVSTYLVGSGNGLVEIAINPLAATLFPTEKTHYLNVLHAWWPGGLIMSGLLALFVVNPLMGLKADPFFGFKREVADPTGDLQQMGWRIKMAMLLVPLAIYGLMCLGQRFPQTERAAHNVPASEMFLEVFRPMFLLWGFCMLLTASSELGPNQWQESVLPKIAGVSGTLVFVYTSALMFGMRFFAGPLAHKLSPVGMLAAASVLTAVGLYWLSHVSGYLTFAAATVFGVGIAYYWPTMLGVTAERFPKGGALLLGLMGSLGNLAISQALPQMGAIYDSYTVQALPAEMQQKKVTTEKDGEVQKVSLVKEEGGTWIPQPVAEHVLPAGARKMDPDAVAAINKQADEKKPEPSKDPAVIAEARQEKKTIDEAEKHGAAWAYRWIAVLPCVLVVIFGLIALTDRLRGGYKAVHITEGRNGALGAGPITGSPHLHAPQRGFRS
jgi:MFS family permease